MSENKNNVLLREDDLTAIFEIEEIYEKLEKNELIEADYGDLKWLIAKYWNQWLEYNNLYSDKNVDYIDGIYYYWQKLLLKEFGTNKFWVDVVSSL